MRRLADLSLRWKIPLRVVAAVLGTALALVPGTRRRRVPVDASPTDDRESAPEPVPA